jgi:hypothetical protein
MLISFTRTAMGLTLHSWHSWLGLQSHTTSVTQNTASYGLSDVSSRRPLSQFKWHATLDELLNVEALSLLLTSLPPSLTPLIPTIVMSRLALNTSAHRLHSLRRLHMRSVYLFVSLTEVFRSHSLISICKETLYTLNWYLNIRLSTRYRVMTDVCKDTNK